MTEHDMSYLGKRGATYYFRRSIPDELQPIIGRREFMVSLKTKDREEAKRRRTAYLAQSDQQLDAARDKLRELAAPPPVPPRPKSQAQLARLRAQEDYDREQDELAEIEAEEVARAELAREDRQPLVDDLAQRLANRDAELSPIEMAAKDLLSDARFELEIANQRLANMAAEAKAGMARYAVANDDDAPAAAPQPKGKGVYLDTDILEGWATERKPGAKGRAAYAAGANLFNKLIGRKSAELITKADVMAYKNKLLEVGRSQVNVRYQLSYLRTLLDWAAQEDMIPTNPAKDVRIKVSERGEKRKDFNIDDLNALFSGPVYTKGERPERGGGEAAYWLPLLALFMGARREELGQLRVTDVKREPYIDGAGKRQQAWCINITDTPDGDEALSNQIKNAASRRLVPLHPKLIELGFIRYVQSLPDQRGRVFPELIPNRIEKLTDKWGQWFSEYKRACGITDKLKVFHSFRHLWKTRAGECHIPERVSRQFQGHQGRDEADKYGSSPSMAVLVKAIASYTVPGLVIPTP